MRCGVPAVALSRVGARVVESGPDGQDPAAGTWQRLSSVLAAAIAAVLAGAQSFHRHRGVDH